MKKGRNKEYDRLAQINLALLFGEESGLLFYYRKLPGNITDVKTVKQLMAEFDVLGYKKVNVIFDRGLLLQRQHLYSLQKPPEVHHRIETWT